VDLASVHGCALVRRDGVWRRSTHAASEPHDDADQLPKADDVAKMAPRRTMYENAAEADDDTKTPPGRAMTRKRRRLWIVLACGIGLGSATALVLLAFNDNLVFFVAPSDLAKAGMSGRTVRLGGLVEQGSVIREAAGTTATTFRITDGAKSVTVTYNGILPDLFREGQGIIAHGTMNAQGAFVADEVLAKHDEKYMPPEVAASLKNKGAQYKGAESSGSAPAHRVPAT